MSDQAWLKWFMQTKGCRDLDGYLGEAAKGVARDMGAIYG